jgi:hypothetical protein
MSAPTEEEEHTIDMLTPWEKELEMLEDWFNNPGPKDGCQQIVMQIVGEDHSTELLRNFSQEVDQMMTTTLKPATEEGAKFQSGEQLEKAGNMPAGDLAEANLSEGEAEQQLSDEIAELESAAGRQDKAIGEKENRRGDRVDLPIAKKEVQ